MSPEPQVIHASSAIPAAKSIRPYAIIRDQYAAYLTDESRLPDGRADTLVFAHSEEQAAQALADAFGSRTPVTLSAGRTGIVGGAVPMGGTLLSLERMNRFLGAVWNDDRRVWTIRVQPGLTIECLQALLDKQILPSDLEPRSADEELQSVRFFGESAGWFYPPDPTEKSAHLGGTVSTNASGARSFVYGPTRNFVRSMRVACVDGTVLPLARGVYIASKGSAFTVPLPRGSLSVPVPTYGAPKVKNTAGFHSGDPLDLVDLFIGSEGVLGAVTEIELELRKKPGWCFGGIAFFPSEDEAVRFVTLSRHHPILRTTVLEYFDTHALTLLYMPKPGETGVTGLPVRPGYAQSAVYFELEETSGRDIETAFDEVDKLLIQCGTGMADAWGAMDDAELAKMGRFRHAVPEAINQRIAQRQKTVPGLHKLGTDFAVDDLELENVIRLYRRTLDASGLEYVLFGHIGENHLHINMIPRNEEELLRAKSVYLELARAVVRMGGALSAEHGIGKIKKHLLGIQYNSTAIDEMKRIKTAFDPQLLLNPGNLF